MTPEQKIIRAKVELLELASSSATSATPVSRTKTKSPQTNGICERFHRTVLDEFYPIAFFIT
jgi:hypothetical protein